jgi:hypothetical protein
VEIPTFEDLENDAIDRITKLSDDEIQDRVMEIVARCAHLNAGCVGLFDNLTDCLCMDYRDLADLESALESEFYLCTLHRYIKPGIIVMKVVNVVKHLINNREEDQ